MTGRLPIAGPIPLMLFCDRKAIVYSIFCLQLLLPSGYWTASFLNFELATCSEKGIQRKSGRNFHSPQLPDDPSFFFQVRLSRELKHESVDWSTRPLRRRVHGSTCRFVSGSDLGKFDDGKARRLESPN